MATHTFFCVDGHTCGNPVRLVAGGAPRRALARASACFRAAAASGGAEAAEGAEAEAGNGATPD